MKGGINFCFFVLSFSLVGGSGQHTFWDVVAPDQGPIGLELSSNLMVIGFAQGASGATLRATVEVGDELFAVNSVVRILAANANHS
jgi:hypothetical protein